MESKKKCRSCQKLKDIIEFPIHEIKKLKSNEIKVYYRADCIDCYRKIRNKFEILPKHIKNDIVYKKCAIMAMSARQRIFNPSENEKHSYGNLREPWGFDNVKELRMFLYENFYDDIKNLLDKEETPSIDRINPGYGYTKNNIRILSLRENARRAKKQFKSIITITSENELILFESINKCAEYFNRPTPTMGRHIRHGQDIYGNSFVCYNDTKPIIYNYNESDLKLETKLINPMRF